MLPNFLVFGNYTHDEPILLGQLPQANKTARAAWLDKFDPFKTGSHAHLVTSVQVILNDYKIARKPLIVL